MTDPASGSVAATTAIATTTGTMLGISTVMPPGASINEFVWGCIFSIVGAFAYQFIEAQANRQKAAEQNIPVSERPKIDVVMLGYSMCGAPMAAACLIFAIHQFHGATGFGDTTWLQSAAGFMVAGAAGPKMVFKVVGALTGLMGSKTGGKAQ
jgi:hypothetical protein